MRKARDLIGMPVVVSESRTEIERVEGLVLDLSETHVTALVVDSDDWSRQARVLPLHDVQSFGNTEIAVSSSSVIHAVDQIPDIRQILKLNQEDRLTGTRLMTCDGVEVGTVNDVLFNEDSGSIESFECFKESKTDAFLEGAPLPLYDELDCELIVHASGVTQLEKHERDLARGASKSEVVIDQVNNHNGMHWIERDTEILRPSDTTTESIRPESHPIQAFLISCWEEVKHRILELCNRVSLVFDERRIQRALGQRAKSEILDKDDAIIVNQGDVITAAVVERAKTAGVLKDLLRAVDRSADDVTKREGQSSSESDDWYPPFI